MARGDFTLFNALTTDLANGVHDFSNDTIKLAIVDNTLTPTAADTTPTWSDYSANEVSTGGGYTANGETVGVSLSPSGATLTIDDDSGDISLDQNLSGFEDGYWGILYNDTATSDEAIGFLDLGGPVSEVAGPVSITWNSSGIFTIAIS